MVLIGRGTELSYDSDKWTGEGAEYVHRFRDKPLLLSTPDGSAVLLIHERRRRFVTNRGLVG
jgi:hypothetical protein